MKRRAPLKVQDFLIEAQNRKGLTNRKAAAEFGCDKNSYGAWIRGLWPPDPKWIDNIVAFTGQPEKVVRETLLREHNYIKANEQLVVGGQGKVVSLGGKRQTREASNRRSYGRSAKQLPSRSSSLFFLPIAA